MGDKRKMKHTPEEIKNRLSNIGEAIGNIALDYITELEKENAILKEQVNILDNSDRLGDVITEAYKEQLTKAKDILQRLMENQPTPSSMYEEIDLVGWREVNKEAEQFLSEVEK